MVKTTTNPDPNQGYTLTILRIPGAEPTALFFEDGQDPRGDFLRLVYAHGGTDFFAEHPQPLAQS